MIRNLVLSAVFFLAEGCAKNPPHIIEAHRVINEHSNEIRKEGFYLFGSGGYFYKQINQFNLSYENNCTPVNIEKARGIIVEQAESFFKRVNNDDKVKPYLKNYPCDQNNVRFDIHFNYPREFVDSEKPIVFAVVTNGKVTYSIDDGRLFKNVYTEPYAEAYQKVYGRPLPARGNDTE